LKLIEQRCVKPLFVEIKKVRKLGGVRRSFVKHVSHDQDHEKAISHAWQNASVLNSVRELT